jgi:Ca2+-binding EF-hand superfamily protein
MTRWPSTQRPHRLLAVAVLATLLATFPAAAQPSPLSGPIAQLPACAITPGLTLADYLVRCRFAFHAFDADNDGVLTSADQDRMQQRFAAGMRATRISLIMRADLDGDGVVTRDEAVKYVMSTSLSVPLQGDEAGRQSRIDHAVDDFMKADLDHDGVIDAAEMLAYAKQNSVAARTFTNAAFEAMLARAADGKVTLAQFDAAAEEVFHRADTDGDGVISREESEAWRRRPAPGRPVAPGQAPTTLAQPAPPPDPGQVREAACIMPVVPMGAKVIMVSTYRGTGVSTIAIGSQDVTTSVARVTIEDGAEPLYVVLVSAAPVIWQFDGAVARVTRAVLVSNHAAYPEAAPRHRGWRHRPCARRRELPAARRLHQGLRRSADDRRNARGRRGSPAHRTGAGRGRRDRARRAHLAALGPARNDG